MVRKAKSDEQKRVEKAEKERLLSLYGLCLIDGRIEKVSLSIWYDWMMKMVIHVVGCGCPCLYLSGGCAWLSVHPTTRYIMLTGLTAATSTVLAFFSEPTCMLVLVHVSRLRAC